MRARGVDRLMGLVSERWERALIVAASATCALLVGTSAARAQSAGEGFLFRVPRANFALRLGYAHASANSDIFSLTTDQFTVDRGDFSSFAIAGDFGLRVTPRVDVVLGSGYVGRSAPSEYRDFVDQDNLPIEQTTKFERVPVTAGLKLYLTPRGRAIGHYAWIPSRLTPYIGGGGGGMWYRFRQSGDFIDPETNEIFSDELTSSGWALEGHAMAGVDVSITPRFAVTGEGRYTWASARMDQEFFQGFDRIDLSGFTVTAGVAVRF